MDGHGLHPATSLSEVQRKGWERTCGQLGEAARAIHGEDWAGSEYLLLSQTPFLGV